MWRISLAAALAITGVATASAAEPPSSKATDDELRIPGIFDSALPGKERKKGRWLLGGGLRLSKGPDGFDAGVNAKLRVNFDFRRLFRRNPASAPSP